VAIIGGSGTGKSVTLKCILGLLTPDSGSITVDGEEVVGASAREIAKVRAKFGMLFQGGALFDSLTVWENVTFALLQNKQIGKAQAKELAGHSSDWWRQVGAIAWRGPEILGAAWNHHCPSEYAPYTDGDPRDGFSRGVRADLSTAIHAEASVVAAAAKAGTPLRGADLYVTTFPCPACARLIAEAGFRRCYFAGPYSVLEGDAVLRAAGVELLWVDPEAAGPETAGTTAADGS